MLLKKKVTQNEKLKKEKSMAKVKTPETERKELERMAKVAVYYIDELKVTRQTFLKAILGKISSFEKVIRADERKKAMQV